MKRTLIAVILTTAFSGATTAGPFEEGLAAYERGDYATALTLLRPTAEAGDAGTQFYLAEMYRHGRGVPQSDDQFLRWYHLAAAQWPDEDLWLVRVEDHFPTEEIGASTLAFTGCNPNESNSWVECVNFDLSCGLKAESTFTIVSDARNSLLAKRLVSADPYSESKLRFDVGNVSFAADAYGFGVDYNDMNGEWDLTLKIGAGVQTELFRALSQSEAGSPIRAEVAGEIFDLTPRDDQWRMLADFARACAAGASR